MGIKQNNRHPSSNSNYNSKWFMNKLLIYVPLMSAFRRIKIILNSILSKSSKNYSSSTSPSSEFKVLPPGYSKIPGFLFMSIRIVAHFEEMYTANNMTENSVTSAKFKRSIDLEVNKTEFWSVNSE